MSFNQRSSQQKKITLGMISLCMVITLVFAAMPLASASAVVCKYKHTVQAGETLYYIAQLYNINYLEIAKANDLKDPYTIMVGEQLCIPGGEDPDIAPDSDKKDATLTVYGSLRHILVAVENFPKRTPYYVRLESTKSGLAFKIGNFRTNKEGDFTGWFTVPNNAPRYPEMVVCVKNAFTDAASCVVYEDYYALPNGVLIYGCGKAVR